MSSEADNPDHLVMHGTAVEHLGAAAILVGPSRSGKSALALELMSMGARLVSDDLIVLRRPGQRLEVAPPPDAPGGIEATGVGILAAESAARAEVRLIVDLGLRETDRLPPLRRRELLGTAVDVIHGAGNRNIAAAVLQFLKSGRIA